MSITRPIRSVASIAAFVAVALGMGTYTHTNFTNIHVLFGLIVALALLILSLMAAFTARLRRLGAIGVAYALLMPVFGLTQQTIVEGSLHWLVETAHLAVGFGAVAFIGALSAHLMRRKIGSGSVPANPAAARDAQTAQPIG